MAKTTFIVTAPDGTIAKRTSATREYTHSVLVAHERQVDGSVRWNAATFHGTEALAHKEASTWTVGLWREGGWVEGSYDIEDVQRIAQVVVVPTVALELTGKALAAKIAEMAA